MTFFLHFNKHNTLVSRIAGGVGIAYGNSEVLPYIKQYYGGGTSGIRAWRVRTLGPGSYDATAAGAGNGTSAISTIDQTGDMKIEMNLEQSTINQIIQKNQAIMPQHDHIQNQLKIGKIIN